MNDRCVVCKNPGCQKPIPLLHSNLLGKEWFETLEPQDGLHEIFLCPECDHLYDYTQLDSRPLDAAQILALTESGGLLLGLVEFECSSENCGFHVRILRPIPAERHVEEVAASASIWTFASAHCQKGHAIDSLPDHW